ncbi:contactin-like [Physella acuta]|uniref:contactin-like n=1 Tax=Physella acuta TaxID=109671 RepID=UPI0027DAD1EB|nr:contactin-like [Physella acuta]
MVQRPNMSLDSGVIIYTQGATGPGWLFTNRTMARAYICKIPRAEAYRIVLSNRGFDYGIEGADMKNLETGPFFIEQPNSVVVVSQVEDVVVECLATGNPLPVYKWFRGANLDQEVTENTDPRYTLTNGKLTISSPSERLDGNNYRCTAENKFGKIISNTIEIAFGFLGEFNNVQDAGTRGKAFEGATVECSKIRYKPAVSYNWYKGPSQQFVRTEFQTYIFISRNGKLYFSEVTRNDEAEYTCVVNLIGVNQFTIGSNRSPSRNSLPIPLLVQDQTAQADWGPVIQNDFIGVFPNPALAGQDIRLECFAYGSSTSPFTYKWTREDNPMPSRAQTMDSNRVLVIYQAQLEDNGIYRCTVSRGASASDTKTLQLTLGARPYFVSPLMNQHADIDSRLTWICNARGNPEPVYYWYKNGEKIQTDREKRIQVVKNVLSIEKLSPDLHNGMYQCGAENNYGSSASSAQLRVLAFKPNLDKYPPPVTLMAPQNGNVTIRCNPEGSPFPTITWTKDGAALSSDGAKYTIYANGNIYITSLSPSDHGVYVCKAVNIFGEAQASTALTITGGAAITLAPSDQTVIVNNTVFLPCEASYPKGVDLVYEWTFNGFPLFLEEVYYRQVQDATPGSNGLYILNAQFRHEGVYICNSRTPFNTDTKSAYIKVNGPPKQPAGVHSFGESTTTNSTVIAWTAGADSGSPITEHLIQAANEFTPDEWTDMTTIKVSDSYRTNDPVENKHSATVEGLNPGTGYTFRVLARNVHGYGEPSDRSTMIQTLQAAPAVFPKELRGGGGSVGDLTIRWNPLLRSEYGSDTVGYRIFWRPKSESTIGGGMWRKQEVTDPNVESFVTLVGVDNYYLPYEVKIQAFNVMGSGPNSSIAEVMSADGIPIAIPLNVNTLTINVSAIQVWWDPLPEDRETARGKILGYQLNYWNEEEDPGYYMQSIRYYGNIGEGKVIGLDHDINCVVDVQVYNQAGLGPRSNYYIMETSSFPPLHYPEEVRITSVGAGRAHVWWRGLTITYLEEDITGYLIYVWTATENPRSAREIKVEGRFGVYEYTISNLTNDRIYALRVAGDGKGGTGKKSPTMYFALEGQIMIDSSFAETIDVFLSSALTPKLSILFFALNICIVILYIKPFFLNQ